MDHADGLQGQGMQIAVFYAPEAGEPDLREVRLPAGATAEQAVQASGMRAAHPELATLDVRWGVDGQRVLPHHILQDGDRIDLCRPLQVDPMTARRLRAKAANAAAVSQETRRAAPRVSAPVGGRSPLGDFGGRSKPGG